MTDKQKQGKRNRQAGARFELKVRADLESNGWIVDRWSNNVEFQESIPEQYAERTEKGLKLKWKDNGKLIKAKSFMGRSRTNGFPDFIVYKIGTQLTQSFNNNFSIQTGTFIAGVECKSNGYLDKEEKAKCKWLLENNIFSKILIASKGTKRGKIIYKEFNLHV